MKERVTDPSQKLTELLTKFGSVNKVPKEELQAIGYALTGEGQLSRLPVAENRIPPSPEFTVSEKKLFPKEQLEEWNKGRYEIKQHGARPSIIILGETHYIESTIQAELDLIERVKPQFVLHEFLERWIYNPQKKIFELQADRRIDSFDKESKPENKLDKRFIRLSNQLGFQIIGCDLTHLELNLAQQKLARELPDQYQWHTEHGMLIKRKKPNWVADENSPEIDVPRNKFMTELADKYDRKSKKSLIMIMGRGHGEKIEEERYLDEQKRDYIFVDMGEDE